LFALGLLHFGQAGGQGAKLLALLADRLKQPGFFGWLVIFSCSFWACKVLAISTSRRWVETRASTSSRSSGLVT
jgi:hypothetical protein